MSSVYTLDPMKEKNITTRKSFKRELVPRPPQELPCDFLKNSSKLKVEIGAGTGDHALILAAKHPESTILAIERTQEKSRKMIEKAKDFSNLTALRADAINIISHYIKESSVDEYYLLYPNPFPLKARWPRLAFNEWLIKTLKPSGTITLATNISDYFYEAKDLYQRDWGLDIVSANQIEAKELTPRSAFEKKYFERKEALYQLILKRAL